MDLWHVNPNKTLSNCHRFLMTQHELNKKHKNKKWRTKTIHSSLLPSNQRRRNERMNRPDNNNNYNVLYRIQQQNFEAITKWNVDIRPKFANKPKNTVCRPKRNVRFLFPLIVCCYVYIVYCISHVCFLHMHGIEVSFQWDVDIYWGYVEIDDGLHSHEYVLIALHTMEMWADISFVRVCIVVMCYTPLYCVQYMLFILNCAVILTNLPYINRTTVNEEIIYFI